MGRIEILTDPEQELSSRHYEQLEAGNILLFPEMPVELPEDDQRFLLCQRQTAASYHKNIAYRPAQDTLTGAASGTDHRELRRILRAYSRQAARVLTKLLPRYAAQSRLDYASYRPFEEDGRKLPLHSRNDLLHVDAFPTRPTNGDRILRFFTNLNPAQPRAWILAEPFDALVERFAGEAGLLGAARRNFPAWRRRLARLAAKLRLHQFAAPPYDAIMHRFHNFLKECQHFQETTPKVRVDFPPKSSWLVFTDMATHAAIGGQFALEQTFIVSRQAMVRPELAPVSILERMSGAELTWRN